MDASFSPLTYIDPSIFIYFSQRPRRMRFHGDGLRNRSVGGEGVCVIKGEIHLPSEPRHVSEPRAPRPAAHPQPQRRLSQRLEEQQQPALLLQGVSQGHSSTLWFLFFHLFSVTLKWLNSVIDQL